MPGPNKPRRRVSSKLVDASVVKQGQTQQGKAAGTVKGYAAILSQADEWLPNQLKTLIEEQVNRRKALQTNGLPAEFTAHRSGELTPIDSSARDALRTPMECTPHLISLFEWSKCTEIGVTSEGPTPSPAGASVLKTIHAAFMWQFEHLWVLDFQFYLGSSSDSLC